MTNQLTKEQLQAIIDGCEGVTPGPWDTTAGLVRSIDGDVAIPIFESRDPWKKHRRTSTIMRQAWHNRQHIARLDPATVKAMATLALQSLDREGVRGDEDLASDEHWNAGVNYAIERLCEILGVDPKGINWDAATETLDGDVMSVIGNVMVAAYGEEWSSQPRDTDLIRSSLSPHPETAKEVGETEAALDGPELWEIVFGVFKGDVPEELTDEKLSQIAAAVQRVFIHPAPQSPPAPVVDEGMKLLEENCWDMRCLSSPIADTGDADIVWHVIEHHMAKPMERVVGVGSTPQEALIAALEGRS